MMKRTLPGNWLPNTLRCAVVTGIRTVSSWSWPFRLWPLDASTPMTVNGLLLMRIVLPMRIFVTEQVFRDRLPQQGDARL